MTKAEGKYTYTKLHHVGLVVKDIDKAMAYFESIGIGPFKVGEQRKFTISFKGELHGKPAEWKTTISNANLGGTELELLEPTEGNQALKESLDATGEGLHHIGFLVDDLETAITKGKKDGLKIWTRSIAMKGPNFLYFEPAETGSLAIELRTP
ncbi:MAG TPA: VOC family protein [Dehalococcoidales bacterium]|nr:VOC family protein [Dehalococcoidales bacterium]